MFYFLFYDMFNRENSRRISSVCVSTKEVAKLICHYSRKRILLKRNEDLTKNSRSRSSKHKMDKRLKKMEERMSGKGELTDEEKLKMRKEEKEVYSHSFYR
jgi:hypothetical protein